MVTLKGWHRDNIFDSELISEEFLRIFAEFDSLIPQSNQGLLLEFFNRFIVKLLQYNENLSI